MKILHTADWHLGRSLYQKRRYAEFEQFLAWLVETIREREIDVLLIAGDVFDTGTPGTAAQGLYYEFLINVLRKSSCRHVVVTGGNHDSPSFLDAPKSILAALSVRVVGSATENPEDEVVVLRDEGGEPILIVAAVPYLRDRDVRKSEAGESAADKGRKLIEGIQQHYASVGAVSEKKRAELGGTIPVVGMGHLFAAGGKAGEGVRELYIGGLGQVTVDIFPACFDYVALGHLHIPQSVGGRETVRYSGSPIPMGFGEAGQQKVVYEIEFAGGAPVVRAHAIPQFQRLVSVKGDWDAIAQRLGELKVRGESIWVEVEYEGAELIGDLRQRVEACVEGSQVEVLQIKNPPTMRRYLEQSTDGRTLEEMTVEEVFQRRIADIEQGEAERDALLDTFREALHEVERAATEGVVR